MARRPWLTAPLVGVLVVLGGCGTAAQPEPAAPPTGAPNAVTDEPATAATPDTPEATSSADPSRAYLIRAADLPEGWRDSNPPNSGFRMTVCGVDTEPVKPTGTSQVRFAQSAVGPFLYEYVRSYADPDQPAEVLAELAAALSGCTEFTTRGSAPDSPEATFEVSDLTVAQLPEGAVAWRMTPRTENPIVQDVVFVPRGDTLVAFLSASVGADPDPTVLTAAIDALPAE